MNQLYKDFYGTKSYLNLLVEAERSFNDNTFTVQYSCGTLFTFWKYRYRFLHKHTSQDHFIKKYNLQTRLK